MIKSEPHFTRQAIYGDCLDQSQIDRSYSSDRGHWMEFFREVVHDATQTLLDHHPSLIKVALQPVARSCLTKSSYAKLDANQLEIDSTWLAAKYVWADQMREGRDPQVNWELWWLTIKVELKKIRKGREEANANRPCLEDELFELKLRIGLNPDEEHVR